MNKQTGYVLVVTGLENPGVKVLNSWDEVESQKSFLNRVWEGKRELSYHVFALDDLEYRKRWNYFLREVISPLDTRPATES